MRTLLTLTFALLLINSGSASTESVFITEHIIACHELNKTVQNFDSKLLDVSKKDTALKYIDNYSLVIEKSLTVYSKHMQSDNSLIKEVATDLNGLLTKILKSNYLLLGKIVKTDFDTTTLKTECAALIKQNKLIANFLKDVSIGICMTTVKDKPKRAKANEQFSMLTKTERDAINKLLVDNFGTEISTKKKEAAINSFEYSCVAIYEFLNLTWTFTKE